MVLFVCSQLVFAGAGSSGAQFLKIMPSARSAALGDTGATLAGADALYINPAGIAGVDNLAVNLSQVSGLESTGYSNAAVVKKFGFGSLGLGINSLAVPSMDKFDNTGAAAGTYSASDMAVMLSYAREFGNNLKAGVSAKMINCTIDDVTAQATAVDIGGIMSFMERKFFVGLAIQNAGSSLKFVSEEAALPLNIKLGGKYMAMNDDLSVTLDLNSHNDTGLTESLGLEYGKALGEIEGYARVGYNSTETANTAGFTIGIGLVYKSYSLDIGMVPGGQLGTSTRFSLGAIF
jgi:hypothetical protein